MRIVFVELADGTDLAPAVVPDVIGYPAAVRSRATTSRARDRAISFC
jgi:hypothetical protein